MSKELNTKKLWCRASFLCELSNSERVLSVLELAEEVQINAYHCEDYLHML
jgi:hypothetical protein